MGPKSDFTAYAMRKRSEWGAIHRWNFVKAKLQQSIQNNASQGLYSTKEHFEGSIPESVLQELEKEFTNAGFQFSYYRYDILWFVHVRWD